MFLRIAVVSAIVLPFALINSTGASAGVGSASGQTAAATAAVPCEWIVQWPSAGVYEKPTRMNHPLKVKHAGDRVGGGYCMQHFNESEQEMYVSVTCSCAEDNIGWMRRAALRPA